MVQFLSFLFSYCHFKFYWYDFFFQLPQDLFLLLIAPEMKIYAKEAQYQIN